MIQRLFESLFANLIWVVGLAIFIGSWAWASNYGTEYLYKNTYEIENIDRFADPVSRRINYLGSDFNITASAISSDPNLKKIAARAIFLPIKDNFCQNSGPDGYQLQSNYGTLFTVKYKRSPGVREVEFFVSGSDLVFVGMTTGGDAPLVCFTNGLNSFKLNFGSADIVPEERNFIVMTSSVNAGLRSVDVSSREQRSIELAVGGFAFVFSGILIVGYLALRNISRINSNTENDMKLKKMLEGQLSAIQIDQKATVKHLAFLSGYNASNRSSFDGSFEPIERAGATATSDGGSVEREMEKIFDDASDIDSLVSDVLGGR